MTEQTREVYKKFYEAIKEITQLDEGFKKFKEEYLKRKKEWKVEYNEYLDYDTFYFIDMACRERNIQLQLSHRLMHDFARFILICLTDKDIEKDAWLWKPKEWWFYFWKYYEILFEDVEEL